jgi:hypothetical protein
VDFIFILVLVVLYAVTQMVVAAIARLGNTA